MKFESRALRKNRLVSAASHVGERRFGEKGKDSTAVGKERCLFFSLAAYLREFFQLFRPNGGRKNVERIRLLVTQPALMRRPSERCLTKQLIGAKFELNENADQEKNPF